MNIWFSNKLDAWVSDTGEPVCQDHIELKGTCPYHKRK